LKFFIQWLACSALGIKEMRYSTMDDKDFSSAICMLIKIFHPSNSQQNMERNEKKEKKEEEKTVGEVYDFLIECATSFRGGPFAQHIWFKASQFYVSF
jgi:hypothetical protein